ncbi:MAG: hypothetical protein CMG74_03905 [Candidatus Marinimicrobia bacterium]|nr:hypothetical protein [Candidatus Neomarinimicrobiota bacterium]|tara:strand:- start:270 stop:1736 length:1467 start_codon:yes stop_codon:yes gene_type:complete
MKNLRSLILFCGLLIIASCGQNSIGRMVYSTNNTKAADFVNEGLRFQDNFANQLAKESFQKAIDIDPEFAFAYYCLAWITPNRIERNHIINEGQKYLRNANIGEKAMIDPMARSMKGDEIKWQEWLESFSPMHPKETRYINLLGNFANNSGNKEKAEDYYLKSISIKENAAALNSLAYLYQDQEKMEEAKDALDRQIKIASGLANPYDSMGDYFLKENNNQKAKEYFEKALNIDPGFMMSTRKIWRIQMNEDGNEILENKWSSDSSNAIKSFEAGLLQFYNIHWNKAREYFEKAVNVDPEFAMPYLYLLLTPGDSIRGDQARKVLESISGNSTQFEQEFIEFNIYWSDNRNAYVDDKIDALKLKYPTNYLVMLLDGQNQYRKKEYNKASEIYTDIWEKFDFVPVLNMIGYSNMQAKNMAKAKDAFTDYISNNGGHPNPYDSMGEYLENMNKFDDAYDYYMMAFTLDSTFTESKVGADSIRIKQQGIIN